MLRPSPHRPSTPVRSPALTRRVPSLDHPRAAPGSIHGSCPCVPARAVTATPGAPRGGGDSPSSAAWESNNGSGAVGNISSEVAERYGIEVTSGAFVQRVSPGSGAEGAGLQQGDVIIGLDGSRVRSAEDVGQAVRAREPGDQVEIVYVRDGQEQRGTATLGSG